MKTTFATLCSAVLASPALAHSEPQLHFHGTAPMLIVGAAAAAIYVVVEFVRSRQD